MTGNGSSESESRPAVLAAPDEDEVVYDFGVEEVMPDVPQVVGISNRVVIGQ